MVTPIATHVGLGQISDPICADASNGSDPDWSPDDDQHYVDIADAPEPPSPQKGRKTDDPLCSDRVAERDGIFSALQTLSWTRSMLMIVLQNMYAVHKEYWKDDYIQYFVRMMPSRKAPEISRGYYARVQGIKTLLNQFLEKTDLNCQIVSIGAGFDTLFWQLHEEGRAPANGYYEMDLKPVTARKCMAIKSRRQLHAAFPEGGLVIENDEAHSSLYHLLAADIRHLQQMEQKLLSAGLSKSMPTLFFAECVLIYLEPKYSTQLMEWVAKNFKTCLFINYDPVNLSDRFGQVMLDNLQNRHCSLLGASSFPSLEAQEQRFLSAGWELAKARDMMDVYNRLSKEEVTRIEKLEFLDEINLLYDLLRHYCISWASKDAGNIGLGQIDF